MPERDDAERDVRRLAELDQALELARYECLRRVALLGEETLVRDSKAPDAGVLRFNAAEWDAFLAGVRAGEFDR